MGRVKCHDQHALVAAPVPSHRGRELHFPFTLGLYVMLLSLPQPFLLYNFFYNFI